MVKVHSTSCSLMTAVLFSVSSSISPCLSSHCLLFIFCHVHHCLLSFSIVYCIPSHTLLWTSGSCVYSEHIWTGVDMNVWISELFWAWWWPHDLMIRSIIRKPLVQLRVKRLAEGHCSAGYWAHSLIQMCNTVIEPPMPSAFTTAIVQPLVFGNEDGFGHTRTELWNWAISNTLMKFSVSP